MIQVGERLPSVQLSEGKPANKLDAAALFGSGRAVIFGVPGAFTPGCSRTHLPGYVEEFARFAEKGVSTVACVSVNDAFVMAAWGESAGATGKIRMLADADGSFTKALGLDTNLPGLGGLRSLRYAMLVEDGVVKRLDVEPDGTGLSCSLAPTFLESL